MTPTPVTVLVVVGTDHHPFDRAVSALDEWSRDRDDVVMTIQYGHAKPPVHATGVQLLERTRLDELLASADVVVTHGGPATIADARANGRVPIVIPRSGQHGEAVDEHQVQFARRLADRDKIRLALDVATLTRLLDEAVADPTALHVDPRADVEMLRRTVERFAEVAADTTRASFARRRRRWWGAVS